jgi:hypothetical protein
MTERFFAWSGHISSVLLAAGVALMWWRPDDVWGAAAVHAGLVVLMLTPVSRVVVACVRFARVGDRGSVVLTLGILGVILISAVTAWSRP